MSSTKQQRGVRGSKARWPRAFVWTRPTSWRQSPPPPVPPCLVVSADRSADRIQQSAQERRGAPAAAPVATGAVVPVRDRSGRRRRVNSHRAARARPFNNENHVDDGGGCGREGRRVRSGAAAVTKPLARRVTNQMLFIMDAGPLREREESFSERGGNRNPWPEKG